MIMLTGYHVFETKEIVLSPRRIALRYLKTFFIFDVVGVVPFNYIAVEFFGYTDRVYLTGLACTRLAKFVRLRTMLDYFKHITSICNVKEVTHDIVRLMMLSFFLLHWWACITYITPKIHYIINGKIADSSWIAKANMLPTSGAGLEHYAESLLVATCHFYLAGIGMYPTEEVSEQIVFVLIFLTGITYFSYIVVVIFEILGSTNASESKYEEIVSQMHEYMVTKKLSSHLRKRMIMYYENRFQKHYFREEAILSTLSEHLRLELFTYCSKRLIDKVDLFNGVSKTVTGDIMAYLKQDVFLPNDVIYMAGVPARALYFIVSGTVAVYTTTGKELLHLNDGEHFGEIELMLKQTKQETLCTCVAADITECLHVDKEDLWHLMSVHDDFTRRIMSTAKQRYANFLATMERSDVTDPTSRSDLVHELRSGGILSRSRARRPLVKT